MDNKNSYNMRFYIAIFTILLTTYYHLISHNVIAQDKWSPKDFIHTEYVGNLQFSQEGNMVVWTKRRGLKEKDKFVNDIYLTRLDLMKDGMPRTFQMTGGEDSDYSPIFSKDGETIYFLSSRKKGKKLWSLSIYGGEAQKVHEFKNGISNIQWLNDSTLAFVSNDGKSLYDQKYEKLKDNTEVVEDSLHWTTSKVYAFDLKNKSITRLTDIEFPVAEYAISGNSRYIITSHTMSRHFEADAHPKSTYYLKNLETGMETQVLEGLLEPNSFDFTINNQGFYFLATKSSDMKWVGVGKSELYYFSIANMSFKKIDLGWDNGIGEGYNVVGNDVLVSLANGPTNRMAYIKNAGNTWKKYNVALGDKNDHVEISGVQKNGSKIAFTHSTASKIPTYFAAKINYKKGEYSLSAQSEFVKLNEKFNKKKFAKSEIFRWTGANEDEVNGILFYPTDYEEGKKYPLILSIHGGPSSVSLDEWAERWSTYPNYFAQKGAFVLQPNYHGSSNHGQAFVESIKANYYNQEMIDIVNGINTLNEKGMVDMDKLGVMGWSNGAILTTMLTLRYPDMFKAAAPGAGDINWTSDFGTCRFGVSFDQYYFGGAPWDDVNGKTYNEAYILQSPLFEIEKIKTPTIIFHGSNDRAVPRDQGWEYYRALQQVGKAPVKFLWFPNQPHGLQKITHQMRKMQEEIAWFDKYLFETEEESNEAMKDDSPLAMIIQKNKAARVTGFYGVEVNETIIPEMVSVKDDSISVARFELTNAQYKAFDGNYAYKYGTANHPVYNLEMKDVQGYINWLNELTGKKYRLPNKKEAMAMHKKGRDSKKKENTLNYWAGYEINQKDASLLLDKVSDVEQSLIKEVGSFDPISLGSAKVYDLHGNVSECYLEDNEMKIFGYSAYDYVDPNNKESDRDKKYVGVRLVLD